MTASFASVAAFLDDLDPSQREIVEALSDMVQRNRPQLDEQVKWNSPTYTCAGVDLMTINVRNRQGQVQLVLHRGTQRKEDRSRPPVLTDDEGIVTWVSDIRGLVRFPDRDSLLHREAALQRVIDRWLDLP